MYVFAIQQQPARARLFDPGDDLHQRRFARAIFADQHVDRARVHLEIHAVERLHAGVEFRHALSAEARRGLGHGTGWIVTGVTTGGTSPSGRQAPITAVPAPGAMALAAPRACPPP